MREVRGKRSLIHSLILKRMNEMAGAFNFFTGDVKEMKCVQLSTACPVLLPWKGGTCPSSSSWWQNLKHLPPHLIKADLSLSSYTSLAAPQP